MKILLASPIGKAGGIARWTEHILRHYASVKSSQTFEINHISMSLTPAQNVIHRNLWHRIRRGVTGYYAVCRKINKELCDKCYNVFHFTSSASISLAKDLLLTRIAHKHGVKAIVHFHFGRIPELKNKNNWEWKLLCAVVKVVDTAVVIDKLSYDVLLDSGYTNIRLLPNPIAPKVQDIIRKNNNLVREDNTILFVGHGIRTKGIYELVDACRNIPNIKVKMLGTILDSVKKDIYKYSNYASWLDIKGEIPYDDVIKEMLKCDIFVLPTYTEGFPNVILESMACGCAIVTTTVGAIPEMLMEDKSGHYGIMIEPRNAGLLNDAINKMLNNEDFKTQCRLNVQHRVYEKYNIEVIWQHMVEIWKETASKQLT